MITELKQQTISASTVQRRLRESGLHGPIAAKIHLLRMNNKKKRIVWAKKHKDWTLDQWNLDFGLMGPNLRFWFQPPCLCETRGR